MANKKGIINLNYNLKDKSEEQTLVYLIGYFNGRFKVSTTRSVYVKTWDSEKQRCIISTSFADRINRASRKVNKFLDDLDAAINKYMADIYLNPNDKSYFGTPNFVKDRVKLAVEDVVNADKEAEEKKAITPLKFFRSYVENMHKKVDVHTGRYISDRTIVHHKTVLKRYEDFFAEKHLKDDFSVFDLHFQELFIDWAYTSKNYRYNTIPASFSLLKVWLNEAARQGLIKDETYKSYRSKSVEVFNIYLTEDEISRLYALDIPMLKSKGVIDAKSTIEETRDLFIIGCWTGLRQSDLNHLEKALFDVEAKEPTITVLTEKTAEMVKIPMHHYIRELYVKYGGKFPKMCYKSRFNEHLKELGRLAEIDEEVMVPIKQGGKSKSVKYKKYQLIKSHTARRSFATNLYLKGAPTISIMKLTGHTTEANFMKYIKVTREENAQLMQQFFK
ncbi:MAG: tyrosine-type recombinase/integrase [Prevotella sp.]|nr:tyrosine-type recombinase/integrase [Prevotella sp.]